MEDCEMTPSSVHFFPHPKTNGLLAVPFLGTKYRSLQLHIVTVRKAQVVWAKIFMHTCLQLILHQEGCKGVLQTGNMKSSVITLL